MNFGVNTNIVTQMTKLLIFNRSRLDEVYVAELLKKYEDYTIVPVESIDNNLVQYCNKKHILLFYNSIECNRIQLEKIKELAKSLMILVGHEQNWINSITQSIEMGNPVEMAWSRLGFCLDDHECDMLKQLEYWHR
jgi:hypothetical protein